MKKTAIVLLLMAIGTIVGTSIAALMYVRQATQLPAWISEQNTETSIANADPEAARARIMRRMVVQGNQVETEVNSQDLGVLVKDAIASRSEYRQWLDKAQDFNARIEDGTLRTGATVNLQEVVEQLGASERQMVEQAIQLVPGLAEQPIYVGIEGQPRVENGQLWLDDNMVINVGGLRLSPSLIARQLGVDPAVLQEGINLNLNVEGVDINTINLEGDRAIIRGVLQQ